MNQLCDVKAYDMGDGNESSSPVVLSDSETPPVGVVEEDVIVAEDGGGDQVDAGLPFTSLVNRFANMFSSSASSSPGKVTVVCVCGAQNDTHRSSPTVLEGH